MVGPQYSISPAGGGHGTSIVATINQRAAVSSRREHASTATGRRLANKAASRMRPRQAKYPCNTHVVVHKLTELDIDITVQSQSQSQTCPQGLGKHSIHLQAFHGNYWQRLPEIACQQYHQAAKDVVISPKILQCEVKCFK
ncbi:hypothetical protein EVAR_75464_1 [Eumeta japonica]|uniref:Uncharacterized protein n=1 Tax=Eumeta variegata TaxID=151549 RepID=A0A4C1TLE9_EUMVA|nr:hypothetical protein EVAR_75464_1 [Eumeta japonica]